MVQVACKRGFVILFCPSTFCCTKGGLVNIASYVYLMFNYLFFCFVGRPRALGSRVFAIWIIVASLFAGK